MCCGLASRTAIVMHPDLMHMHVVACIGDLVAVRPSMLSTAQDGSALLQAILIHERP